MRTRLEVDRMAAWGEGGLGRPLAVYFGALLLCLALAPSQALASLKWGTGVKAALPANAASNSNARLTSVSCASAGNCTAVGFYNDSSGNTQGLMLSESSGKWGTGVEAALPANADAHPEVILFSVSCASAGSCAAIGKYFDTSYHGYPGYNTQGLLLSEVAGKWSTGMEPTLPANAGSKSYSHLTSVSCASAGNCTAVGSHDDSSGVAHGLLLSESSGTWGTGVEPTPPPNANPHTTAGPLSVSCPSLGNCTAVGGYTDNSGNPQGALLPESNGIWGTGVEAMLPANAGNPASLTLGPVSCASAGNCAAVGYYYDTSHQARGLLLSESSGTWGPGVEAALPANAGGSNQVVYPLSVSCASAGSCTAVGTYRDGSHYGQGLLLAESSGMWGAGVEATPPPNAASQPNVNPVSVSCASAGNCAAVGTYRGGSGALLLSESSGTWSPGVEAALPANAVGATLNSVSCVPAGNCAAVGNTDDGSGNTQGLLIDGTPPDNHFTASRVRAHPDGKVTFDLKLPGPGSVDVFESAWKNNVAIASLLKPSAHRFTFARLHLTANGARTIDVTVNPNAGGRKLVKQHRGTVKVRVWVGYTPTGGLERNHYVGALHIPR